MALSHHVSLLLLEKRGGRAVAGQNRIAVGVTAVVIDQARKQHMIPSARDVFERLLQSNPHIVPEVFQIVHRQVGED